MFSQPVARRRIRRSGGWLREKLDPGRYPWYRLDAFLDSLNPYFEIVERLPSDTAAGNALRRSVADFPARR